MTNQEVYDKVKAHLLKQGKQSIGQNVRGTPGCFYRGDGGTKCAVGCLIPDELYDSRMEGYSITVLMTNYGNIRALFDGVNASLLDKLQSIHDTHPPEDWGQSLRDAAQLYGLNP